MSAEQLAFLQNFYTDVTLYVPAESAAPAAPLAPAATGAAPAPPTNAARATPLADRLNRPDDAPAPRAGLPKSIPTATQVKLTDRLASARDVAPAGPPPAPVPAGVPPVMMTPYSTMGNNPQGVVLLFRLPADQFQKLHRNVFLNKMLQALNMVMADVMLVNVESELPVALANLRQQLAATQIIAFGKNLLDTTIRNTQIYEPVLFPSLNLAYLASATVDLVEYDVSLKKRLWPGLQRMFS
ncbi:hypothetical protein [Hymenobacter properus]|uniref:Uncharacterized protein n=1 Tax=Hymenobacter properus TaxID=2791026 RepID=A0A931BBH4_9BACT|nr:hypothetical protein [Hymenobacter properus]MBF9140239.1 hypothetical protein [Hymenobacter properus]MBR7719046.1 hypothetical protein [Microvirga sp. SRT04]